MNDMLG